MSALRRTLLLILSLASAGALPGCFHKTPAESLPRLQCEIHFEKIEPEDRERVDRLMRYAAYNRPEKKGKAATPTYHFEAKSFDALDRMHALLVHKPEGFPNNFKGERTPRRIYTVSRPTLELTYSTASLTAAIDISVSFTISPGSKLFYKPQDLPEQDVTEHVNRKGKAKIPVKIHPGQRHIYCRVDRQGVEKFIRIDIYTQRVEEIRPSEYPR